MDITSKYPRDEAQQLSSPPASTGTPAAKLGATAQLCGRGSGMLVQTPAQGPPEAAAEPAESPLHTESAPDVTRLWRGHALVSNTASEAQAPCGHGR